MEGKARTLLSVLLALAGVSVTAEALLSAQHRPGIALQDREGGPQTRVCFCLPNTSGRTSGLHVLCRDSAGCRRLANGLTSPVLDSQMWTLSGERAFHPVRGQRLVWRGPQDLPDGHQGLVQRPVRTLASPPKTEFNGTLISQEGRSGGEQSTDPTAGSRRLWSQRALPKSTSA